MVQISLGNSDLVYLERVYVMTYVSVRDLDDLINWNTGCSSNPIFFKESKILFIFLVKASIYLTSHHIFVVQLLPPTDHWKFYLIPDTCTFIPTNFLKFQFYLLLIFKLLQTNFSPSFLTFPNSIWVHPHQIFQGMCFRFFFHCKTFSKKIEILMYVFENLHVF